MKWRWTWLFVAWTVARSTPTATRTALVILYAHRYAMNCPYEVRGACEDYTFELNKRHRERLKYEVDKNCPGGSVCFAVEE